MARDVDWVTANLVRLAKRERKAVQPYLDRKAAAVPVPEQMRRFLSGAERWQVDAGLVTPEQYVEYQREMLKRLGMEV
jgi:hypothetical protein